LNIIVFIRWRDKARCKRSTISWLIRRSSMKGYQLIRTKGFKNYKKPSRRWRSMKMKRSGRKWGNILKNSMKNRPRSITWRNRLQASRPKYQTCKPKLPVYRTLKTTLRCSSSKEWNNLRCLQRRPAIISTKWTLKRW